MGNLTKCSLLLLLICFTSISFADSTQVKQPKKLIVKTLKPITNGSTTTVTFNPNSTSAVTCPNGYALTQVSATAQSRTIVDVYGECNGVAAVGYAHVWCQNALTRYRPINNLPTDTYVCRKIENEWATAT